MKNIQKFEEFVNENYLLNDETDIKTGSLVKEGSYADLKSFLNDVVAIVQKNKKDFSLEKNKSVVLDVDGKLGYRLDQRSWHSAKEIVVIDITLLAKDLGVPESFVKELVNDTFNKYKKVLKLGYSQTGQHYITYKK